MKRLVSLLVCCFIVVLFSGCAQLIIAELEDRANEKGRQNIKTWATNNIPIGASEDDILQRLGTPNRKESDFWIYPLPANVTKIPKGSNLFVAIVFSHGKVVSWLGYGYRTGSGLIVDRVASYKGISIGMSKYEVSTKLNEPVSVYFGSPNLAAYGDIAYSLYDYRVSKETDIWLLWENSNIVKPTFFKPGHWDSTIAAIFFQDGKVVFILYFEAWESSDSPPNLDYYTIIKPEK